MLNRKYPLWPWQEEGASLAEYKDALNSLKRFLAAVDINQLQTLEDVSAIASLVGHDLRVIAVTNRQVIEEKIEYLEFGVSDTLKNALKMYSLKIVVNGLNLVVSEWDGYVNISQFRTVGFQGYQCEILRIKLPSDRDIAIGNRPNVEEHSLHAFDLRGAVKEQYLPTSEPSNAQIQQGFMRLLKECIEDILSVLAP